MDEQRVEVYFDSLRPDYPEYLNALEKEALRTEVPIIRRATRDVLRYLLKTKKPARVLEVGTAIGLCRNCLGRLGCFLIRIQTLHCREDQNQPS